LSSHEKLVYIVLAALLCINLVQGFFMGLAHDEAYYWVYSKYLDWGYFDHPPLTAPAVGAGYWLIPNELGVRLVFLVMLAVSLWWMWKMTNRRDGTLFITLILSFALFQIVAILATPDTPILFFATMFFIVMRHYLKRDDIGSVLLLGLSMALMLYSKYHGILVILFTVLAVPRLLKKKTFWLSAAFGTLFFLPHIIWQVRHDFVTIAFQLGRASAWFNPNYIVDYVTGQVAMAGVFSGLIVYYVLLFRFRSETEFERVLKFNCIGTLAFFLFASLKGRVEANWTIVAYVPLGIIAHRYLQAKPRLRRATMLLALFPIALIVILRVLMTAPPDSLWGLRRAYEFSDWPRISEEVEEFAGGLPITANLYQHASSISFYSGEVVPSLNINSRENQFTLLRLEDDLLDTPVCFVSSFEISGARRMELRQGGEVYLIKGLTVREIKERFTRK
jgi:4-amino-4-deoxy-L-arabinose transferase-like glycosyltransferase